jgi:hypothetical protein
VISQSTTPPVVERWQDGYRIPLNIEHHEAADEFGEYWTFDALVVRALTAVDVSDALAVADPSDPGRRLAAALDAIADVVAPSVTELRNALIAANVVTETNISDARSARIAEAVAPIARVDVTKSTVTRT